VISLLAALTVPVSAVLLLALIGALCLHRGSASARHWVLAAGVGSALAMPALRVLVVDGLRLRFDLPFGDPLDAGLLGAVVVWSPEGSRLDGFFSGVAALASDPVVGWLAVTVWLAGAGASLGVLLIGLARLRWLRATSSHPTEGRLHRLCADLSQSCGLKRGVDLLLAPSRGLVATWGWRRPIVMLPASASGWPAERLRVVLLHELAHARRGDWVLLMAAETLRCIWWFNPLAWMVRGWLRRESEHAADDLVLAQGVAPTTCAAHLVEIAREVRRNGGTWLPAPAMARPSYLKRRLSVMLDAGTNRRPMTRLARFGSLGVFVSASILFASLQVEPVSAAGLAESSSSAAEHEQSAKPLSEGMRELNAKPTDLKAWLHALRGELHASPSGPDRGADSSTDPIGTGVAVSPPTRTHGVPPVYPPAAVAAGVEGIVVLEATIGPTGEVTDVEVVRSVPLLDAAAIAAVGAWRYTPVLVDGKPVRLQMTVSVDFTLPAP
jgi:TonB family protein